MRDELRTRISRDLQIVKFNNESIQEYNQRIIYSALSMWVRSLLSGNSVNDFNSDVNTTFPDILYVQLNLAKIAKVFIASFECNQDWFGTDAYGSISMAISDEIIKQMIYLQEIGKVLGRKLSPVPHRRKLIGQYVHEYGKDAFNKKTQTIGVSMWTNRLQEDKSEKDAVILIDGRDYCSYIDRKFPWTVAEVTGTYEVFKVGFTRAYSKAWVLYESDKVKDGIYLLRDADNYEPGYMLIKKKCNQTEIVTLDPWYVENKEIYRIMYALNVSNGTPANFKIRDYGDYVVLHYASALPDEENRLIQSVSWPYSKYNDKYSRIIPYNMWEIVSEKIARLGAIVTK